MHRQGRDIRDDPALAPLLDLLARDLAARPEILIPLDQALIDRIEALTHGIVVDADAPIEGDAGL
jgi:antitoxin PrlF